VRAVRFTIWRVVARGLNTTADATATVALAATVLAGVDIVVVVVAADVTQLSSYFGHTNVATTIDMNSVDFSWCCYALTVL
jgi:hypothetical protein